MRSRSLIHNNLIDVSDQVNSTENISWGPQYSFKPLKTSLAFFVRINLSFSGWKPTRKCRGSFTWKTVFLRSFYGLDSKGKCWGNKKTSWMFLIISTTFLRNSRMLASSFELRDSLLLEDYHPPAQTKWRELMTPPRGHFLDLMKFSFWNGMTQGIIGR